MARQIYQSIKNRSLLFYFISFGFAILLLLTFNASSLTFTVLTGMGVGICLISFLFVGIYSVRGSNKQTQIDSGSAEFEKLKQDLKDWVPEESPAIMLGASGIYSIVFGLGITDALGKYAEFLNTISSPALNAPLDILGTYGPSLSYTCRLLGFLVTIIPFIHGALLMFSNKWYFNKEKNTFHFGLAFIFFIFAFIHSTLFFFVALNIPETSSFLLILWIVMIVNVGWLLVQVLITRQYLDRNEYFLSPWILINMSTFVFLSMFMLTPSRLFSGDSSISNDFWLNLLVLVVLTARSAVDYFVGWKSLYNKIPKRKKVDEIMTLSSTLRNNQQIATEEYDELNRLAAKKLSVI